MISSTASTHSEVSWGFKSSGASTLVFNMRGYFQGTASVRKNVRRPASAFGVISLCYHPSVHLEEGHAYKLQTFRKSDFRMRPPQSYDYFGIELFRVSARDLTKLTGY